MKSRRVMLGDRTSAILNPPDLSPLTRRALDAGSATARSKAASERL
jgi:hypothetical protein